ncbi:LysR family transcriptional regulator [Novosphingobium soli]|uniref:LysR family transcriptional regulator n=1 Tax=Novosphingobium soli TaxID=574956 RepID=UPI00362A240F
MIDQYLLRYFLAVAETGNFSRAAKRVSVTQPTLSAGIAKLERELGARLFDRDRQGVALTPAGSRFLVRARRIAAEYEHALVELGEVTDPHAAAGGRAQHHPHAAGRSLAGAPPRARLGRGA